MNPWDMDPHDPRPAWRFLFRLLRRRPRRARVGQCPSPG